MNPFLAKGYVEIDGVLTKLPEKPGARKVPIVFSGETPVDFSMKPSTDEERLNQTEKAYLAYLKMQGYAPGVQDITLKLGDDCRYTPEFNYVDGKGRFTIVEVKGFMRDDAQVKLKVAARLFRRFNFVLVRKKGTGWDISEVKP